MTKEELDQRLAVIRDKAIMAGVVMYRKKRVYGEVKRETEEITESQRKEILDAYDYAMTGAPVAELTGNEFQKDGIPITQKVTEFYKKKYNSVAIHPELGEVKLDLEGVKDSLGHGIGRIKAAAYAAVPQLIKNGKIFSRENNWKGRGYDTVVMLAPLKINGIDYVGEVVVEQRPNRQGFYLHEVEVKEKLADVFKTPTEGSTSPASKLIISQLLAKVKSQNKNNLEFRKKRLHQQINPIVRDGRVTVTLFLPAEAVLLQKKTVAEKFFSATVLKRYNKLFQSAFSSDFFSEIITFFI